MERKTPLHIAYIGNGKSTNRYHIPFVLTRSYAQIDKIWSRSGRQDWPVIEGVTYTQDLSDIWQDSAIDLVVITTPGSSHYEYAKLALQHGKHVLVEKPFVETVSQAQELFDLAKEKGLILQCYQNRRFDSDYLTSLAVMDSGKLGTLHEVEMHYDYYRPHVPLTGEFSKIDSYLYAHGAHTLDQAIAYFGQPEDVRYDVRQLLGPGRMNDYFDLDLMYASGVKVSIKSSYFRVKPRPSFVLYGDRGVFVKQTEDRQEEHLKLFYMPGQEGFGQDLPQHYGTLTYVDEDGIYHEEKVPSIDGDYGRYYNALYDTIIHGQEKLVRDEDTLTVMRILEEGLRELS